MGVCMLCVCVCLCVCVGFKAWVDVGILCVEGTGPDIGGGSVKGCASSSLSPLNSYTFFTCLITGLSLHSNVQLAGYLCLLPQAAVSPNGQH